MTVEEFQSATASQLREKANDCFTKAAQTGSGDWPGLYMEAQFYLAEIERRESAKVSKRDYKLEIWVIILIGVEIALSVLGLVIGYGEGAKQITALNSLNQSTAMTASNISKLTEAQTELTTAQKNTVNALQDQLEILRQQQKQRLAELTKQPVIGARSHILEITPTTAKYQVVLQNSSEVAEREFMVYFEAEGGTSGVSVVISDSRSSSVYIPLLGPGAKQNISLNAQYPGGTASFHIRISASGQNISAKTLGDLLVTPPAR